MEARSWDSHSPAWLLQLWSQLWPVPLMRTATPRGSGGAGGAGVRGRPSLEKQKRRWEMKEFSCSVLRLLVRQEAAQYSKGVVHCPVSGLGGV